jgi:hypothetical protein
MKGKNKHIRLTAKEQVAQIEKSRLEKYLSKGLAYSAIIYSFNFS